MNDIPPYYGRKAFSGELAADSSDGGRKIADSTLLAITGPNYPDVANTAKHTKIRWPSDECEDPLSKNETKEVKVERNTTEPTELARLAQKAQEELANGPQVEGNEKNESAQRQWCLSPGQDCGHINNMISDLSHPMKHTISTSEQPVEETASALQSPPRSSPGNSRKASVDGDQYNQSKNLPPSLPSFHALLDRVSPPVIRNSLPPYKNVSESPVNCYPTPSDQASTVGTPSANSTQCSTSVSGMHKCPHPGCEAPPFPTPYLLRYIITGEMTKGIIVEANLEGIVLMRNDTQKSGIIFVMFLVANRPKAG